MRPDLQRPPAVPDTLTPGDQLLAAGLGIGAAASGLVWASGQLAGLAFGHTWLELDPAEVAQVVLQLRHHLDDPALAWPTSAQQALPGPAGMYASFVATTAGAAGAAGGAMRLWQRAGLGNPNAPGARTKRPAAGSATWATPRELRPLRARRPEPGRVILGRAGGLGGRLLAAEDCHSVLVFGPPGSFKTAGAVIPAILEWIGPVLATSVKPDVIKATRAHRERRGEVVVLDPLGSSGLAGARWTPLAFCRSWAGAQQIAATIAHTADLGTLERPSTSTGRPSARNSSPPCCSPRPRRPLHGRGAALGRPPRGQRGRQAPGGRRGRRGPYRLGSQPEPHRQGP